MILICDPMFDFFHIHGPVQKFTINSLHLLLTAGELKSALHEDGVAGPGLGADDPPILHDDLGVEAPPGARPLLYGQTLDEDADERRIFFITFLFKYIPS